MHHNSNEYNIADPHLRTLRSPRSASRLPLRPEATLRPRRSAATSAAPPASSSRQRATEGWARKSGAREKASPLLLLPYLGRKKSYNQRGLVSSSAAHGAPACCVGPMSRCPLSLHAERDSAAVHSPAAAADGGDDARRKPMLFKSGLPEKMFSLILTGFLRLASLGK